MALGLRVPGKFLRRGISAFFRKIDAAFPIPGKVARGEIPGNTHRAIETGLLSCEELLVLQGKSRINIRSVDRIACFGGCYLLLPELALPRNNVMALAFHIYGYIAEGVVVLDF